MSALAEEGLVRGCLKRLSPPGAERTVWTEGVPRILPRGGAHFLADLELARLNLSAALC